LDKERGSPMEIEAILGNALKRAKARGLSVPQLEMVYSICSAANQHIINMPKL
jgi:2-dehydropantoate 2-reductase